MYRAAILALALACAAPAAMAQQDPADFPSFAEMASEIRAVAIEGPNPQVRRRVYFWRPPSAPEGDLPVLYVADGDLGLYLVSAGLRAAIAEGRIPPLLVVGLSAHRENRHHEYVLYRERRTTFEDHERWFLETVMPLAERVAGASPDPSRRAVGGFSNGADFALAMIERHPELFGGALIHSPAAKPRIRLDDSAAHIRWVMTAGRQEGSNNRIVALLDRLTGEIQERPAAIRRCVGNWGHENQAWRDISPGSIAWLFNFPEATAVETTIERESCSNAGP